MYISSVIYNHHHHHHHPHQPLYIHLSVHFLFCVNSKGESLTGPISLGLIRKNTTLNREMLL